MIAVCTAPRLAAAGVALPGLELLRGEQSHALRLESEARYPRVGSHGIEQSLDGREGAPHVQNDVSFSGASQKMCIR